MWTFNGDTESDRLMNIENKKNQTNLLLSPPEGSSFIKSWISAEWRSVRRGGWRGDEALPQNQFTTPQPTIAPSTGFLLYLPETLIFCKCISDCERMDLETMPGLWEETAFTYSSLHVGRDSPLIYWACFFLFFVFCISDLTPICFSGWIRQISFCPAHRCPTGCQHQSPLLQ